MSISIVARLLIHASILKQVNVKMIIYDAKLVENGITYTIIFITSLRNAYIIEPLDNDLKVLERITT